MTRLPASAACAALILPVLVAACGEARVATAASRPHVLLICLDTVRADRLAARDRRNPDSTPNLDALAARGVRLSDVSSTSGWTKPSVPSFMTGMWPLQHGVYEGSAREREGATTDVLPAAATTLAEVLQQAGWSTAAFVQNAQLRTGLGFEQGFDLYRDEAGDAREITDAALSWLDENQGSEPTFLYLHMLDAHWPYDIPADWAGRYTAGADLSFLRGAESRELRDAVNDGATVLSPEQLAALDGLYDGAIAWIDDQLGRLLDGLDRRGRLEDTLVVVVADHGEEFLEHGRLGHGHGLWENLLSVDWVLAGPGIDAGVHATPSSLIDLPSTILGACGVTRPEGMAGVDRIARPDGSTPVFAEHKAPDAWVQSLRSGFVKIVRRFRPPRDPGTDALASLIGTRWEAEFEWHEGRMLARQLKPLTDDEGEDPEIKGLVGEVEGSHCTIAGWPVRLQPGLVADGDPAAVRRGLTQGAAAKVRGRFVDGILVAERLKLYDAPPDRPEIRGSVGDVIPGEPHARLRIGSVWLDVDGQTVLRGKPGEGAARLSRDRILEAVQLGGDAAARAGWHVEGTLYDLARDPRELHPLHQWIGVPGPESPPDVLRLSRALDESARSLAASRVWHAKDRLLLGDEDLEALRAIGYVR